MDREDISRLREAMNATTMDFLHKFTPKLDELFDRELSLVYLNGMNGHLQTFYSDVLAELETKENDMSSKIDALRHEADELKRKLNVDIGFDLTRSDGMPLMVYQEKLDSDLSEMRERFQQKMDQIEQCLNTQSILCNELNENLRELSTDPLASDSEIFEFEQYLIDLKAEKFRRLNEIERLQREIHVLSEEMGLDTNEFEMHQPDPTIENIKTLKDRRDLYAKERENLKVECEQILEKLKLLWECLECPSSIQEDFIRIAKEYKISSRNELRRELKACKAARQANLKQVIENIRVKLIDQWNKVYKSQEERDSFEFLRSETYTEDLFQLHQLELEECVRFFNDNKEIFDLYQKRNQWWEKKKALEAKQNEPNRYNNRGGQLLKEEKERKQTDIEIPKIEKRIKTLAEEFRREHDRDFTINGVCIIDLIDQEWEAYRGTKDLLKSARKGAPTPSKVAMTPKTPSRLQTTMKRVASTTNLGMTTGNLAKKRHLDVPSREVTRTASVQKSAATSSYLVRSHTKRNLLKQYDDNVSGFVRPTGNTFQSKRAVYSNKKGALANLSANKIVKKYRRSSRVSKGIISDESIMNYDTFEKIVKTSQSNSSMAGEVLENENIRMFGGDPMSKLSVKNNNLRTRSPLKPANLGTLQTNNIIDLV